MKVAGITFGICGMLMISGVGYAQEALEQVVSRDEAGMDKTLQTARAMMDQERAGDAYALLAPLEYAQSGNSQYDYLLGIAALDSGRPDKATLAFERVLAVDPNLLAARMDMARAYFQLGDVPRAQYEFNLCLTQHPDADTRITINKYLYEIKQTHTVQATRMTGYVEGGLGHDTNVNNSTSATQIAIPFYGSVVASLNPTNVKTADSYYRAAAGGTVEQSLDAAWGVYAGANISQHADFKQTAFDLLSADGRAGVIYANGVHHIRTGVEAGDFNLSRQHYLQTTGIDGEYRYVASPSNQYSVFGQLLRYRYVETAMQLNDFNQPVLGVGWMHVYPDGQSSTLLSVYHGIESVASSQSNPTPVPSTGRTDGDSTFNGIRVGGQSECAENVTAYLSAGLQSASYDKVNPYFLQQRADKQYDITLASILRLRNSWTLRPQLSYVHSNSNILVYSFNRADVSLTLRRDFQ